MRESGIAVLFFNYNLAAFSKDLKKRLVVSRLISI